jgi:O-methyltransferase
MRSRLSAFVNRLLAAIGYAIVRIDDKRLVEAKTFAGVDFAYDNLYLLDTYAPWITDEDFRTVWEVASRNSLTNTFRSYELYQCVREVARIPGDILEVGVWRGGTAAVLSAAAAKWKPTAKVWLCDTFSGVVKAGVYDASYSGGEHADTTQTVVADLLSSLKLTNASIVRGVFPDESAAALLDAKIALCHIDVDVYQSAADIVGWLRPRLSSGSMIVFDDYGFSTCKGITRYVNELRMGGEWIYLYNLNKHAVLIKR